MIPPTRCGLYSPNVLEGGFSEVELPIYGVLRSWLRGSADGIMLVAEGNIPLALKRKSPVVDHRGKESG